MILHGAEDLRVISINTLKQFVLLQNKQNRQQNKLVETTQLNINLRHIYIYPFFLNPDVYILKLSDS